MANISFQEKTLWVMLAGLVLAFGFYFSQVLPTASAEVMPYQVVLFVLAVVFLVLLQVIGAVVVAIIDRRPETDERDRLIELQATRTSAYVLATGVFLALCAGVFIKGNFVFTHVLLGFWVLAQVVEIVSRLFLYRRGA